MGTRRRNGRLVVRSAPSTAAEGRRAPVVALDRERLPAARDAAGATAVLASALLVLTAASPEERSRAGGRVRHARSRLVALTGRQVALAIERQLRSDGGRALRTAQLVGGDLRQHALASAATFAQIGAERGCESTASFALLGLACRWHALAHAALDAASTATGDDLAAAVSRARYAAQETRLALLGALALEREARQLGTSAGPTLDDAAIHAAVARAEAEALAGSRDSDDDEPEDDARDGEGHPAAPAACDGPPVGGIAAGAPAGAGTHARRRDP
ncbi:MAG: hypothetical protein L6Q84_23550 [Polyangiaceae bacterium]|nr:hypothetical protein [Polyangiaceae bacterium]